MATQWLRPRFECSLTPASPWEMPTVAKPRSECSLKLAYPRKMPTVARRKGFVVSVRKNLPADVSIVITQYICHELKIQQVNKIIHKQL